MTILEPATGDERMIAGSGIAAAATIQELSQQAAQLASYFLPSATFAAAPSFGQIAGLPSAEQEYRSGSLEAWNGMILQGEVYFAVMAISTPGKLRVLRSRGKEVLESARFQGPPRSPQAEQALIGQWVLSDNRTTRTGVRDKLMYMSNWTITFLPGNRFRSFKETFVDTSSEVYGGGNTGAANRHTGRYRIFGQTLVAEFDGGGRQIFSIEPYPNGAGIKLNGQLFLRQ